MSVYASALYSGVVVHRRFGATPHTLRYRMAMALLNIDEIDALATSLRLFSRGRFNLFSFYDRDHLPPTAPAGTTLRTMVDGYIHAAGLAPDGGAIRLLSLPRILGYAFNPLSVYFCHRQNGDLAAIVYEVRNTFKQRHFYVIPADPASDGIVRQRCLKAFYVSPFLDMDMTYDFRIRPPGERVDVAVDGSRGPGRVIAASFSGRRRPLSDAALLFAFLGHPMLALSVVAGIHWEALRLWLKGVRLRTRPSAPDHSVTIIKHREV